MSWGHRNKFHIAVLYNTVIPWYHSKVTNPWTCFSVFERRKSPVLVWIQPNAVFAVTQFLSLLCNIWPKIRYIRMKTTDHIQSVLNIHISGICMYLGWQRDCPSSSRLREGEVIWTCPGWLMVLSSGLGSLAEITSSTGKLYSWGLCYVYCNLSECFAVME